MHPLACLATLFMGGCSAGGPAVKPLWSVPQLAIDKTPLIHDGIVYVQPIVEANRTHLFAFDLKTGKQLWTTPFASEKIQVIVGTRLVVTDDKGLLHSLDSKTGREIEEPEKSNLLSATAAGNMIYTILSDRSVIALDRPGHGLWKASVPMSALFSPMVSGNNVYIYGQLQDAKGLKDGCAIYAFDATSGALRWKWESHDCLGTEDIPFSAIAADSGAVYIRIDSALANDHAGAVIALDAATGKQKWSSPTIDFHTGAPILFDASTIVICDNIPGDHGGTATRNNPYVLRGLDRATGQMKWESRTASKYETWTESDGKLFIAGRKAHALIGTGNDTSPDSFLIAVDIRTAKELWRSEMVQLGSFSVPAVADGIVVVGSLPFGDENMKSAGLFAFDIKGSK